MAEYVVVRHVVKRPVSADQTTPLSEAVLLILVSLADHPRHGYAILKDVADLSDGRVRFSTGTLYGALRRLLESGWIDRFEEEEASRDRVAYRLTRAGQQRLQAEVTRMKQLARLASLRLSPKEG